MKIGILSTIDSLLTGYIIKYCKKININIDTIIFDSQLISDRDKNIFNKRTGGKIKRLELSNFEEDYITTYNIKNHNSIVSANLIKRLGLDLIINGGTPRILNPSILSIPKYGIINCHPGILPNYRGCTCVEWAIYNNDPVGNTVHLMSKGIDEGPILEYETLEIKDDYTYEDVRSEIFFEGARLISRTIKRHFINNKFKIKNYKTQNKGKYYSVIPKSKMNKVLSKIKNGDLI